jgi:hypothetical protein
MNADAVNFEARSGPVGGVGDQGQIEARNTAHISVVDAPEQTTALIDSFLR